MKWIVFWVIAAWTTVHIVDKDEFGFTHTHDVSEKVIRDTLSREFMTEDSARKFKIRAEKYKPKWSFYFIDTIWIETIKYKK